jgi:hypothetical protein
VPEHVGDGAGLADVVRPSHHGHSRSMTKPVRGEPGKAGLLDEELVGTVESAGNHWLTHVGGGDEIVVLPVRTSEQSLLGLLLVAPVVRLSRNGWISSTG